MARAMSWTLQRKEKNEEYDALTLSFDEIEQIAGVTVDHSLLRYKKEMEGCGWRVEKISLKNRTIRFAKED